MENLAKYFISSVIMSEIQIGKCNHRKSDKIPCLHPYIIYGCIANEKDTCNITCRKHIDSERESNKNICGYIGISDSVTFLFKI